jgi:hypothetical protein
VINVIAEQASLSDETAVQLDGETAPGSTTEQLRQMTLAEALAPLPGTPPADTHPAVVMGGGILPAPLLAAKVADTATVRLVIHPGDSAPEPHYVPSPALARFVRCRDLTCRFPGCDEPADRVGLEVYLSKTPPAQDILRLAGSTAARRDRHLDCAERADLHHLSG